jgi:PAS domain S-box-containing protein
MPTTSYNHEVSRSISSVSSVESMTGHTSAFLWWAGLVCLLTFVADLLMPSRVAVAFLYAAAILLSVWSGQRRPVIALTVVCTGLTIVAALMKVVGNVGDVSANNRVLTIILLWATAFLGLRNQALLVSIATKEQLYRLNQELRNEISERRRIEESLRWSKQRLTEAQEISLVGSWNWDVANNKLTWSDELRRIYGMTSPNGRVSQESQATFEAYLQAVHPEDRDTVKQIIDHTVQTHEPFRFSYRIVRPDGAIRWLQARGQLELDPAGRPVRIYGTGQDISELKQAEDELEQSRQQLRALSAHLQSIREEERKRIAREIHDELGQAMTALKIDLAWLSKKTNDQSILGKVQSMSNLLNDTIQTVRRIATELRPAILDDLGLSAALEWQAQEFEKRTGIPCELKISPDVSIASGPSTELFRVFQEILTNIARHAHATQVRVTLETQAEQLMLEVRDNGIGIRQTQVWDIRSIGLTGMRERVRLLGGEILITGIPGQGTTVVVQAPATRCEEDRPVLPTF